MPDRGVAVVTGAAQGLGRAVALALAADGWRVAAMDVDRAGLATLADGRAGRVRPIEADLADAAATRDAIARAQAEVGPVGYLVHNAAILVEEPFEKVTFERWRATVDVGLQAAYLLTHALWGAMKAAGHGRIVFVSSQSGIRGFASETAYCAAKHGLEGFMKALALEAGGSGVAVSTITPGMYMHTPMSERNYPPEAKAKWVDPARLAPAFVHLGALADPRYNGERLDAWKLAQEAGRAG
jgi:NAD(P)-dependent dehydrogenase (short-subunit alcohol dehydrogenase family)